jgi:uroporphyrinogen decarboxylase
MTLFQAAARRLNLKRPPVWFMRQAGRYHSHYQGLRGRYSFVDVCKIPEIACEATLGPVREFNFDAAILFSDILFPLEAMGMDLRYEPNPRLAWHIKTTKDLARLSGGSEVASVMNFQAEAILKIRKKLSPEKSLLGFVGGPLTLFCYAVDAVHLIDLKSSVLSLVDGRFDGFCEKLIPVLVENMAMQAQAGAASIAIFDTCAGAVPPSLYRDRVTPKIERVVKEFKQRFQNTPVIYYSKGTGPAHWQSLEQIPFEVLGIDWGQDLGEVLRDYGMRWSIQGNIDPSWLLLDPLDLESRLRNVFEKVKNLPSEFLKGWICGLGHGVLPKTPERNIHLFVKVQREVFG